MNWTYFSLGFSLATIVWTVIDRFLIDYSAKNTSRALKLLEDVLKKTDVIADDKV